MNASGAPNCACNTGYSGNLVFDDNAQQWTGACVAVDETDTNATGTNLTEEDFEEIAEESGIPAPGFAAAFIILLAISIFRRRK